MERKFSEVDVTWSSVEGRIPYSKVVWHVGKDRIPKYTFIDDYNNRIEI